VLEETFPQILAAARGGAEWAWTGLYHDLAPSILGYLRTRGASEPEDLTGEVFLQVVRDLHRFEGGERDFRSWVFTIAHHRLIDDVRRRGRRPVEVDGNGASAREEMGDVEQEALDSIGAERVRRIIEGLSAEQRDVLLLRVLGGLTVTQVAQALGKTPGAVKALQRRGLASIEEAWSKEGVTL
jgi:RNA polymerase sigma factor (sigma-70 family)